MWRPPWALALLAVLLASGCFLLVAGWRAERAARLRLERQLERLRADGAATTPLGAGVLLR
ncbi:MAG: hypothetical protein D6731_17705 [Planctomycetota bacterium]|nr:MAG: hypothetical protein D6731_17705 [Planctomycetota bacterium]